MLRRPLLAALAAVPFAARAPMARETDRVLQIVAPWDIGTLEPSRAGYVFTRMGVTETLVAADPDGRLVPGLAARWSAAADGLSWRLALRPAVFHDGTVLSPDIAAAALRRARALPGPFGKTPVTAIEPDGDGVLIRLSAPFAALPAFLAHFGTQLLAPASFDAAGAVRRVIGTGPYRVSGIGLPLRIDVERFDGWTGGPQPAIARASYLSVPRAEARALMAESGQADLAFTLDPPSLARLRGNSRVSVRVVPIPRMELLKLNAGSPVFVDGRVRRAVSLAIDRAGIARAILGNPGAAATQLFPPTLGDWHQPGLSPLRHDPAEGRRLLDEAGWRPGPDGFRSRDGVPFAARLRTYADRPELPVVAAALQDQLRGIGLRVDVAVVNSSEIPAGHADGTLGMALMARNFALVPDPFGTLVDDYGPKGGDWGAMGWSDEGLNTALAALQRGAGDEGEQQRSRAAIAGAIHAGLPVIPVAWYDHSAVISRRLDNVVIDPFELSYNLAGMRWAG